MSQISSSEWSKTRDDLSFALEYITMKAQLNEDGLKFSKSYRLLSTPMRIFVYTHYKKCVFYLAVIRLVIWNKN